MTSTRPEPSERPAKPNAEREPEVEVELIKDLDVLRDDEDGLRAGRLRCSHTTMS